MKVLRPISGTKPSGTRASDASVDISTTLKTSNGKARTKMGNKNRIGGQVKHSRPITAVPSIKSKIFIVQQSANNTNIVVKDEDDPTHI